MATTEELKNWKRSKYTTGLVGRIRGVIRAAGYDEECGVVPLHASISVVVKKGDQFFNLRLSREDLSIQSTTAIEYKMKKDRIRRVYRKNVN